MKSYKNWKLVNESLFPLGLSQPRSVGGLVGNTPIAEAKKKMKGKMHDEDVDMDDDEDKGGDDDHTCSCNKNMKKKMKGDDGKNSKQTPKDHSGEKSLSKEKKKKMGDEMEAPPMMKKKKKPVDDDMGDEEEDDDDMGDEEDDDDDVKDSGDDEGEGDDDSEDVEGDDDDHEMEKYGFMKKKMKKMKKKMKKMQAEAAQFEKDISQYPDMPEDHSQDSEKEFFASLSRQFGKPNQRFSSGLSEDMLVPLNDPNAPDYVAPEEPGPGEVGYAPTGRMGVIGAYSESTEFSTLCKYLGEEAARKLYKGR